ncbi:MAG: D-lyxose/D-mannose family sugar isomerase [Victivallales bacterium]|nr:D-lyxose/D-mannose family sugar isomerase [Victivallales bacterium]
MKRSLINRTIREAEEFFASFSFRLPKFAFLTPDELHEKFKTAPEIYDCRLGWDITDFGSGDFFSVGLFLFTVRNGMLNSEKYPKGYAEKIMISRSLQVCPTHCHEHKREDIICRGGGNLVFRLYNRKGRENAVDDTPVRVSKDGEIITVKPGAELVITPGESLTLTPNLYHEFYAEKGSTVLIGEVSAVNDDVTDNIFLKSLPRFPAVEEDEPPYRLTVSDY